MSEFFNFRASREIKAAIQEQCHSRSVSAYIYQSVLACPPISKTPDPSLETAKNQAILLSLVALRMRVLRRYVLRQQNNQPVSAQKVHEELARTCKLLYTPVEAHSNIQQLELL